LIGYLEKSTIVNSEWFISIVNRLEDKYICNIIPKIFSMFATDEDDIKIKLAHKNLVEDIANYKKDIIDFTQDQKTALGQLFSFATNPHQKTYGLYGFAGTGKTTVIVELVTFLINLG